MEWSGGGFVGLNAKTYVCFDPSEEFKQKHSAKGISRSFPLNEEDYLNVLNKISKGTQTNKGFIFKGENMYTYTLEKEGLTYLYAKRKVLEDGFATTYLDL